MDKLRALQTFVAIVDAGSLTAAADALGSSLPAVVRQLAGLEAALGARLLNRTTRKLSLTEPGRQYLERARRILADIDDADRLLDAQQSAPAGALTVTAPVLFGQRHLAPAVTGFLQRYPAMRVDLVLLDRVVNLVEEGIDVGVRIGHLEDSSLIAQTVGAVRRIVVASPGALRRHGTPAHPRELARLPCLRFNGSEGAHWAFRDQGRALQVPVAGPLQCNLAVPILDACAEGLGFARCLAYQAAPLLRERRLRIVLADYETQPWPVQLTYPSARLLPQRTRVFLEAMKEALPPTLPGAGAGT